MLTMAAMLAIVAVLAACNDSSPLETRRSGIGRARPAHW